jgi:hypothetical protein
VASYGISILDFINRLEADGLTSTSDGLGQVAGALGRLSTFRDRLSMLRDRISSGVCLLFSLHPLHPTLTFDVTRITHWGFDETSRGN